VFSYQLVLKNNVIEILAHVFNAVLFAIIDLYQGSSASILKIDLYRRKIDVNRTNLVSFAR